MAGGRTIPPPRIIRFPPFELDVRAAELRKHGLKVRLHDQPFRVLVALLSRPGEVVLRDEIRNVLWPDDTVVEFDRSINAAIQRLRDALGDSAENPRYVETLARRGYRFIGAVEPAEAEPQEEMPAQPAVPSATVDAGEPSGVAGRRNYWPAVAGLAILLAAVLTFLWRQRPAPERVVEFEILASADSRFTSFYGSTAISPDGRWIVFQAAAGGAPATLWVRPLDSPVARPLVGTEGAEFPFWSPDGKSLAFFAGGKLRRIEIAGGPPVTLCEERRPRGGSWSSEDILLFANERNLLCIPASGGAPVNVTEIDPSRKEAGHAFPQFLPGGRRFLYLVRSPDPNTRGIYVGSLDHPREHRRLVAANYKAIYTAPRYGHPGSLLFLRDLTLMAQTFDAGGLRLIGQPAAIADSVAVDRFDDAAFWASDAGILAYHAGSNNSRLVWMSREGKRLQEVVPGDRFDALALSPDGKLVALCRSGANSDTDIWIYEFGRNVMTRLTFASAPVDSPVWSSDGRQLAFCSSRNGTFQIYRKNTDGSGLEEQLTEGPADKYPDDWSRDGKYLLYHQRSPKRVSEIWLLPLQGDRKPVPLLQAPFGAGLATLSPDGKWIAYTSNESGTNEVYVQAFSGPLAGPGSKAHISTGDGGWPRWRGDGKELFYHDFRWPPALKSARIWVANGGIEAEAPVELFPFVGTATTTGHLWDVSADGQRILFAGQVGFSATASRLNVVVNWQARLNNQ